MLHYILTELQRKVEKPYNPISVKQSRQWNMYMFHRNTTFIRAFICISHFFLHSCGKKLFVSFKAEMMAMYSNANELSYHSSTENYPILIVFF